MLWRLALVFSLPPALIVAGVMYWAMPDCAPASKGEWIDLGDGFRYRKVK